MVSVGGITRVTGSGLSMVEWRPVMGVLPPIGIEEWQEVFNKYRQFPEYKQVNKGMNLEEFKGIFFWEYFHRVWGRLIGVVVLLPWIYFVIRKRLDSFTLKATLFGFFWGGAQGAIGWYMVKSGLTQKPEVSHYRLTLHLFMAFFVIMLFLWIWMRYRGWVKLREFKHAVSQKVLVFFTGLIVVQIIFGAFMAGKKAGYLFDTFPLMRGEWLPGAFIGPDESLFYQLHENPFLIHYVHRFIALLIGLYAMYICVYLFKRGNRYHKIGSVVLLLSVIAQIVSGAITVLTHVHVGAAVSHQTIALVLLSALTYLIFITKRPVN